jgi:protein TonB
MNRAEVVWLVGITIALAGTLNAKQDAPQSPAEINAQDSPDPGNAVSAPVPIKRVDPAYPKKAMDAKITGEVVLDVLVQPDGRTGDIKIVKSLDTKYGLDDEAVKAVQQWVFVPGKKDGTPVAVQVQITVEFLLKK